MTASTVVTRAERRSWLAWDGAARWMPFLLPGTILIVVAYLYPLIELLRYSFYRRVTAGVAAPDWTLANYARFFSHPGMWDVASNTIVMGVTVTVLCLLLGYPLALTIVRSRGILTTVLLFLTISPLLASQLVRALGWTMALGPSGWINSVLLGLKLTDEPIRIMGTLGAVILGLTHGLLPFMVLSIASALSALDPHLERAAISLGASRTQVLTRVLIPLSLPGIVSGSLLVFCIAVGTYGTPFLLGGPGMKLLSLVVYEYFTSLFNWPFGATLSVVLMLIVVALLGLFVRLVRRPWQRA
jgi:putative spermidine/putrescine transport system permease protein